LRANDARLRLRREINVRRVPRWGTGVVDSLGSRRGATSCLAMVAPPPPPSAGKVTGQTRMLLFRHAGKTSSIPPPAGGLTAVVVVVARRRKKYHVVAAVEGHELETPETEQRPGWRGCWRLPIWSLTGSCSSTRSRPLPGAPTVGVSTPRGSLDRRVNCRCVSQPRWVGARRNTRGNKRGSCGSCLSCAQGGCACSRGLQALARERERACASARPPARPPSRTRAPDLPFIDVRRGPRCTMGGVAMC
jgi:hypothetical protein